MSDLELRKKLLRVHDRLWLGAACFAAASFAVMSVFLPGQGWPLFGLFILGIVGVSWFLSRRRIATSGNLQILQMNAADKMRRNVILTARINGLILLVFCALFGLMQFTDSDQALWQQLLIAIGCWSVGAFGCALAWWGFRQPLPSNRQ
jgi:hypothetical protein